MDERRTAGRQRKPRMGLISSHQGFKRLLTVLVSRKTQTPVYWVLKGRPGGWASFSEALL